MENIRNLSINEDKLRDLYLRKIATGEIQGPLTGYPYIDKKFLRYYPEDVILSEVPKKTMYRFMVDNNQENLDKPALRYFGKEFTYREVFKEIDIYAQALLSQGVKNGDVVALCIPSTPESVFLLYAINKIGAVANFIDPRKSAEELEYCLNVGSPKIVFTIDLLVELLEKITPKTSIKNIVSLSATNSLEKYKQILADPKKYIADNKKKKDSSRKYQLLEEFLSKRDETLIIEEAPYIEDKLGFIEYTSGSTGLPKAVELTADTANLKIHQYMNIGLKHDVGDTYTNIIPIFLAFGAIMGIHLPLSMGMVDDLIPAFDYKKILKLIKKSKPNHMCVTPASLIELIHTKGFKKLDLSKVYTWGSGGEGMTREEENIINEKILQQKGQYKVTNGYGASEIGAPFSTEKDGVNRAGSVGIPLPGNNYIIFKHGTKTMAKYNEIGDVCMVVDHPMIKYTNNEQETSEARIELPDGKIGIMLKDAGYVDEDGFLYVKGRYVDTIIKNDQHIFPVDIEDIIYSTRMVKTCAVAKAEDNDFNMFIVPLPNIDYKELENKIYNELYKKNLTDVTYKIYYIDEMPLTMTGKIDRKKLRTKEEVEKMSLKKTNLF